MNKSKKLFARALYLVFALALVAGLTLVPAVQADPGNGVEFETWDDGTAEWCPRFAGCIENYCVKLTATTGESAAKVPYGETLDTLNVVAAVQVGGLDVLDIEWNIYYTENRPCPILYLDTDHDGEVDALLTGGFYGATASQWTKAWARVATGWQPLAYDAGVITDDPVVDGETYSSEADPGEPDYGLKRMLDWVAIDAWADATVMYIGHYFYRYSGIAPAYVDDITVAGVAYAVEPPLPPLDEDYYRVDDEPIVTIYDGVANGDSMAIDIIIIPGVGDDQILHVDSTTDTIGDDLELTETGADTGVFTGSFTLLGEAPAVREDDEIVVSEGNTITLTYSEIEVTALVDDTPPTIDVLTPEDDDMIEETKPDIGATYSDGTSLIDKTSVEIFLDGVDVTEDTTPTTSAVTYTPEEDLAEGSHSVTVSVSDNAGNEATEIWSFRIVSWLVDPVEDDSGDGSLDALDTVGVAVSGATGATLIKVGRYASNPEPETTPPSDLIEDGFFDVKVTGSSASEIRIKFADPNITAESTAYVWDDWEGAWLVCSDQTYNPDDEFLGVKVRALTIPNISDLTGTPFAISGEAAGIKGDFDGDGDIDLIDFVQFAEAYDSVSGDANYDAIGDFDDDGDIDLIDFVQFASVYGT